MSATDSYRDLPRTVSQNMASLRTSTPGVMKAFGELGRAATPPGVLDTKTKELIALAIGVAVRCDDCIAFHTKAAIEQGATKDEILEPLPMAIYMGAGPSGMYASHALAAYDQFTAKE